MSVRVLAIVSLVVGGAGAYKYESTYDDNNKTFITCNHDRTSNLDVSKVTVHFYDKLNTFNENYSIEESVDGIMRYHLFDNGRPLVVYIPGISADLDSLKADPIFTAFMSDKEVYFVMIDYTNYCTKKNTAKSFEKILPYAFYIGKAVAEFLVGLHSYGYSSIHVIGHSFGGQIAGFVGQVYKENAGESISRITSIDPIRTCFHDAPRRYQVNSGKADYVEIFHCSSLGIEASMGDVDFIFNKELKAQPGCREKAKKSKVGSVASCGHAMCAEFYAETITNPKYFQACYDYIDYLKGVCSSKRALAGYNNPGNAYGKFYASTVRKNITWIKMDDDYDIPKGYIKHENLIL